MQSRTEAINNARQVLINNCLWTNIDFNKMESAQLQYIEGGNTYYAVYFYSKVDPMDDYHYACKVQGDKITDYYYVRDAENCTHPLLNDKFHCVEVDPLTDEVLCKYFLIYMGNITREIKYSPDSVNIQENRLCSFNGLPKQFKDIVDIAGINRDHVTGYSIKPYGNMILVNGVI